MSLDHAGGRTSGSGISTAVLGERAQLIVLTLAARPHAEQSSVLITRLFQESGSLDAGI